MYSGLLTAINRKTSEVVGLPLEEVHFRMPTVSDNFSYSHSMKDQYEIFVGGSSIETIIEEEGRSGYRMIVLTRNMEYHLRNIEVIT